MGAGHGNGDNIGSEAGGGSGGSIRIEGDDVSLTLNSLNLAGGVGGDGGYWHGGNGGRGRWAVYYQTKFTGNFTPDYLEKAGTADSLFNAGFETGDLTQWSSYADGGGDLSASEEADYLLDYGLSAFITDNTDMYVQNNMPDGSDTDTNPDPQTKYRARFYVNPNNMTMAAGDVLDLFNGYKDGMAVFHVQMQKAATSYQIRAGLLNDGGGWEDTSWYDIANSWNAVEIDYQALINDGKITLWLNGVEKQSIIYIDNDTRPVTEVRLGAQGIEIGTHGTLYFDDFDSRRFSYIGTLLDPGVTDPHATNPKGWETTKFEYEGTAIAGTPYPQPHAVTKLVKLDPDNPTNPPTELATYKYDQNGNMTCRMEKGETFKQIYNAENRISSITKVNGDCDSVNVIENWTYTYDGDGVRVSTAHFTALNPNPQEFTAYYMGGSFEVTGSLDVSTFTEAEAKSYYVIAGMTVAMKDSSGVQYLLTDHLGSVVATTDSAGTLKSQQRFCPSVENVRI